MCARKLLKPDNILCSKNDVKFKLRPNVHHRRFLRTSRSSTTAAPSTGRPRRPGGWTGAWRSSRPTLAGSFRPSNRSGRFAASTRKCRLSMRPLPLSRLKSHKRASSNQPHTGENQQNFQELKMWQIATQFRINWKLCLCAIALF